MARVVLTSTRPENFTRSEIKNAVFRAVDQLNQDISHELNYVVIKPNLCYYWNYSTGETTDPRVTAAIVDYIREHFGRDIQIFIAEADASAMRTKYAFKILGYEKLGKEKNVNLVNLSEGKILDKKVQVADKELVLKVNKIILDSDLVVNIPKLKCHKVVGFTCSLKNMFGAISKRRKYVYHSKLSEVIVGINKIIRSDIVLVDGIIAKIKAPKKLGLLIAAKNVLAADFVAANLLGYNPRGIGHIRLAEREKLGDLSNVEVVEDGTDFTQMRELLPRQDYLRQRISWGLQVRALRLYSRLVGDIIPPILEN